MMQAARRAGLAAVGALLLWATAGGCGDCDSGCGAAPIFDLSMAVVHDLWSAQDMAITTAGSVMVGAGATNSFSPATVTIQAGQGVTWTWISGTHGVVSDSAPKAFADSPVQSSGQYVVATFPTAGSYPYHCAVHGAMMSGTIVVQ
jgi:plastocyanin